MKEIATPRNPEQKTKQACNDDTIRLSIVTFRGSVRRPPGWHSDGQRCLIEKPTPGTKKIILT
ncbi:MAG: hypothetical protein JWQ09_68 [Segetibacter sp.]|nr:hypothetical protein [Segetibacter sp.]